MEYDHIQHGYTPWLFVVFGIAVMVPIIALNDGEAVWAIWLSGLFLVAILVLLIAFSRLRVTVRGTSLTCAFTWGKPHRVFDTHRLVSATQVRNKWWYGWGVRKLSEGWMYNVWGLDAVELRFDDGVVFRVGTDDPENLTAAATLAIRR